MPVRVQTSNSRVRSEEPDAIATQATSTIVNTACVAEFEFEFECRGVDKPLDSRAKQELGKSGYSTARFLWISQLSQMTSTEPRFPEVGSDRTVAVPGKRDGYAVADNDQLGCKLTIFGCRHARTKRSLHGKRPMTKWTELNLMSATYGRCTQFMHTMWINISRRIDCISPTSGRRGSLNLVMSQ